MTNEQLFGDTIYYLGARREQLNKEIKQTFLDVAKAFMKKYQTDNIQFDLDRGGEFPTFSMTRIDEDNVDVDVRRIDFQEDGEIKGVYGHLYYEDNEIFSEPIDDFYDVDYLELAKCINYQIVDGIYIED